MRSFIRQILAQSLAQPLAKALAVGALTTGLASAVVAMPAFALTNEQVASKLANVPVFVIGNNDGLVLISNGQAEGQLSQPSLYVFMTEQDAKTFLARANAANPQFAPEAQVGLTSLENLYQEAESHSSDRPLQIVYVPEEAEATQATALNVGYQGGVPLFFARLADGSLAPVQQENGETIFPLFFSRADLDALLGDLATRNPEARAAISVGVLPLEAMLAELKNSDDATLNQIRLLPDSATISAIQQSTPQTAPTP